MGECAAKENENPCGFETNLVERSMWLMKCPSLAAAASLKSLPLADDPHLPVAKVILSIDPLASVDDETKVGMELTLAEFGNIPKRYALDMSKDFIPMFVFCEPSSHGKLSGEGKKIKGTYELKG
ncbi:hypothetical protein Rs2_14110 [Raphanus sativus]|uniref:Uncharacterized protein LOC130494642 n=1 Tax=Raphanus sativus TaxID=3726 RepID=A0A9W3DQ66_RAPSA|nr:uncharacterized protein LOC130494642 [Raphanus sativus]KAJ4900159.1 hypothetical protein Rs2_14110 [Raphanus sativus]